MRNDPASLRDLPLQFAAQSEERGGGGEAMARPESTLAITRGAARLMTDLGFALVPELTLPNGRRADLACLSKKGRLVIVEVKSCREDYTADAKWPDYLDFCDRFYFATGPAFPTDILPAGEGRIVADAWGGAIIAEGPDRPMAGARRKAMTLRFARQAAFRLAL